MSKKYYIKCNKCEKLVEIKSMYVVLCPFCKHKMDNSYNAWSASRENVSYNDYLNTICVSEDALVGLKEQKAISKTIKKSKAFKLAVFSISAALLTTIVVLLAMWLLRGVNSDRSIRSILDDNWKINQYEDISSTVKFPFVLQPVLDTTYAEVDTATFVKHIVARQWVKPKVCNVTAIRVQYDQKEVDRSDATSQILQSIVAQNGMEAFQYIPSDYNLGDVKARMLSGSYLIGTLMTEFRAVMVTKDKTVWYFMVAYPESMPEGTLLAEKFFKTIQIN